MDNIDKNQDLDNVKCLFSHDLFEELFSETQTDELDGCNLHEGFEDVIGVRHVDSAYNTSTHFIANDEATQQKLTWASILKGESSNSKINLGRNEVSFSPLMDFPSLMESFAKTEKPKGKGVLPPIGEERKKSVKNKKGADKKSLGNETIKEYRLFQ